MIGQNVPWHKMSTLGRRWNTTVRLKARKGKSKTGRVAVRQYAEFVYGKKFVWKTTFAPG
jgi:hypothetical protein